MPQLLPAEGRRNSPQPPQRRCLVSGEVAPVSGLIRFVISPEGTIVPDVAGRLPGRGLWMKADRPTFEQACRKNMFQRAARARVKVPDDLIAEVEGQLLRRCLNLLGLARRAGEAVFGFERVREWLLKGQAGVLVAAADGDPRDRARLRGLAAELPLVASLTADELGRATGRDRTVHGGIAHGRLAQAFVIDTARLHRLRAQGTGAAASASAIDSSAYKWPT